MLRPIIEVPMTNVPKVPTVVIAGYGSWIKAAVNPAGSILGELRKQVFTDSNVICLEIPVESETLYPMLEQILLEHRPDIWIGLGVAVGSPAIRAEMVGLNIRHFNVPDNKGKTTHLEPIIKNGPLAYLASLPNEQIVTKLREAGIPAVLSFHAGTHLCNQMLYSMYHLVEKHRLDTIHGFLHVPQSANNAALHSNMSEMESSMGLKMMTDAVIIAIKSVVGSHNSYNSAHNNVPDQC